MRIGLSTFFHITPIDLNLFGAYLSLGNNYVTYLSEQGQGKTCAFIFYRTFRTLNPESF